MTEPTIEEKTRVIIEAVYNCEFVMYSPADPMMGQGCADWGYRSKETGERIENDAYLQCRFTPYTSDADCMAVWDRFIEWLLADDSVSVRDYDRIVEQFVAIFAETGQSRRGMQMDMVYYEAVK